MKKVLLFGIIVVLLISLAGCGESEVEEDTYETFVAEYYQTKLALHLLQNRYDELEASHAREEGREAEYVNAISTLQNENQALRIEVALIKELRGDRQGELESVLNELNALKVGRLTFIRETEQKYEALLVEYNEVKALFPPSHFASKDELVKWRANSGDRTGSLELQDLAFGDGYILSVSPDLEYCVAVAGDYLYKITPGDKELVEKLGKVE